MDSNEIWTTIILPIIIGPIFLFAKSIYDRYSLRKLTRDKNVYNDNIEKIDKKLKLFFYPVYLKLLCIYQLNYNIPEEDNACFPLSDSSGSEFEDEENINEASKKYNKKRRCLGVFLEDEYKKCNRTIPKNGNGLCKRCKNILSNNKDNCEIASKRLRPSNTNTKNSFDVHISIPILKNLGDEDDITGLGIGNVADLEFIHSDIDSDTVQVLVNNLNKYYIDVVEIIENNIAVASPSNKFGRELVYFLKYSKIREIVNEGSPNQKYSVKQFGTKNNLNKLLSHIEFFVFELQDQYNFLMEKGP
jgi:hypothetical protein